MITDKFKPIQSSFERGHDERTQFFKKINQVDPRLRFLEFDLCLERESANLFVNSNGAVGSPNGELIYVMVKGRGQ